jgi:3'-phosphoadenosine 5'-phosphosulfate sulfotransferase (PAPS reductase)/FAD synthetase
MNIVSFSGGKDSTAMLHLMIERGIAIDEVVFFDTGWEFPHMKDHLLLVQQKTGIQITKLQPKEPFSYWMFERPIRSRKNRPNEGVKKGEIHRIGNGWPSSSRRWCTRIKVDTINKHVRQYGYDNVTMFVGFAADELERTDTVSQKEKSYTMRFPLIEYDMSEVEALEYCKNLGYHWSGLYGIFPRVSCYCCPLQGLNELRNLRRHFPLLWKNMLRMDSMRPEHNRGFIKYDTVHDLEQRFAFEDSLKKLGVPPVLRKRWSCKFKEVKKV